VKALTCFRFANAVCPLPRKSTDEIKVARRALTLDLGEDLKGALARGLRYVTSALRSLLLKVQPI